MGKYKTGKLTQNTQLNQTIWADFLSNLRHGSYGQDAERTGPMGTTERRDLLAITNIPTFHDELKHQGNDEDDANMVVKNYLQDKGMASEVIDVHRKLQEQTRYFYMAAIRFADKKDHFYGYYDTHKVWYHTYIPQSDGGMLFRQISLAEFRSFALYDQDNLHAAKVNDKGLETETFPESPVAIVDVQETTLKWQSIHDVVGKNIDEQAKPAFQALQAYIDDPSADSLYAYLQYNGTSKEDAATMFSRLTDDDPVDLGKGMTFSRQGDKWVPQFIILENRAVSYPVRIQDGVLQVMFASEISRDISVSRRQDLSLIKRETGYDPVGIGDGSMMQYMDSTSPYLLHVEAFKQVLQSIKMLYDADHALPRGIEYQVVDMWDQIIEPHIQHADFIHDGAVLVSLLEVVETYRESCPPLQSTLNKLIERPNMQAAIDKAAELPPIYTTGAMVALVFAAAAIAYFFFPAFVPLVTGVGLAAIALVEIGSSVFATHLVQAPPPGYERVQSSEFGKLGEPSKPLQVAIGDTYQSSSPSSVTNKRL